MKKIKVVHSNRGSEYYGRYDENLEHLRSTFRNVALMLSIKCLVLLNKMGLRRQGIEHFLI